MTRMPPSSRTWRLVCLGGLLLVVVAIGAWWGLTRPTASPEGPGDQPWLADVASEAGMSFVHDAGPLGDYFMPQIMGSGVALIDADGDGLLDVYLLQHGGPAGKTNQLFRQLAGGRFADVSRGSGLDVAGFFTGAAVADVDNDGRPDLIVTQFGGVRLFLNDGGNRFTDATEGSGLHNPGWGVSSAFVDFDRDGLLDLFVVNYVAFDGATPCYNYVSDRDYCHPRQFPGQPARLFRNLGPGEGRRARFQDVSEASGVGRLAAPGLGVTCADFDGDAWPDIFVANDGADNHLWINQHDGTFKEEALVRGLAVDAMGRQPANMGVGLADVDGDGLFDVFVTHLTDETHTLWLQGPRGLFSDVTAKQGLAPPESRGTGFGAALADLDNDGYPDAAVVNGRIAAGKPLDAGRLGPHYARYAERNQLFANDGAGAFRVRSRHEPAFCGVPGVYRGLAVGDLRNCGALDLVVTEVSGQARLYRNVVPGRGNWLGVRAVDPAWNRDAYGAEVVVEAGGRRLWGWVNPGTSYQSSCDPRAHFGLGTVDRIDRVRVRWPDGAEETFAGPPVNAHVTLRKGEGQR
jgi:hypothetical protein